MQEHPKKMRADAARNRARVLEVAFDVFAEEGLAVPIDEIARRAGVGSGTVYRHFPTKDALFQAIVADRLERMVAHAQSLIAESSPGEALFGFLDFLVDAVQPIRVWSTRLRVSGSIWTMRRARRTRS